jgi:hypothetical protein
MSPNVISIFDKVANEMAGMPNKEITLLEAVDLAAKRWGPENFSSDAFFQEFGMALEHNGIVRDSSKDQILLLAAKLFKVVGRNYGILELIRAVSCFAQIRENFSSTGVVEYKNAG